MNTRFHSFELSVTPQQVTDVTKIVFHTVLLHRSTGKYKYSHKDPNTFSVGSVGFMDIDCPSLEFTYVRVSEPQLDQWLSNEITGFTMPLCQQGAGQATGKISLEFFERKKPRWILPSETVSWETWQLTLNVLEPQTDKEWSDHHKALSEGLTDVVLTISQIINRPEYTPRNPVAENLDTVFDSRFRSVQPYLHKVSYELPSETMAGTVRKLIRNTFAYS